MTWHRRRFAFLAAFLIIAPATAAEPASPAPAKVSFYKDIRPIFQQHCQGCHQPAKAQGGYVITQYGELLKPGNTGKEPVVKGKPEASYLVQQITLQQGKVAMPKEKDPLINVQIDKIKQWIAEGAENDTPASAHQEVYSEDNPPAYDLPAVITALDFSPDGKLLAVGDSSGAVVFWDPATGKRVGQPLVGHNGGVDSVAFDPSGRTLATASDDGKIRLWDVATRKLIGAPLPGSTTSGSVTFFPDGKHVLGVFNSGTGVVWNVDPATWNAKACNVAGRNLTEAEWRDFLGGRRYREVCP